MQKKSPRRRPRTFRDGRWADVGVYGGCVLVISSTAVSDRFASVSGAIRALRRAGFVPQHRGHRVGDFTFYWHRKGA